VREQARALGVTGWVRNNDDGSVEVLAIGDDALLEKLRSQLRSGPAGARVTSIDERPGAPRAAAMDPFGILR
jgi:acylphosphatase